MKNNPLISTSSYPFESVPFTNLSVEDFMPALDFRIADLLDTVDKICSDDASCDFDSVMNPFEEKLDLLSRVSLVFHNLLSAHTNDDLQALAPEISQKLASVDMKIYSNKKLFEKIKQLSKDPSFDSLCSESKRLVDLTIKHFARNGANLNQQSQQQLLQIQQKLSTLQIAFGENSLKSRNAFSHAVTDESQLIGLPKMFKDMAKEEAIKKGKPDTWVFTLQAPSLGPVLKYCENEKLRELLWRANAEVANNGEFDNKKNILEIVKLRKQKAELLGFKDFPSYVLEERMSKNLSLTTEFVQKMLNSYFKVAKKEIIQIQEEKNTHQGGTSELKPWDTTFYVERLKNKLFKFDENELRPFLKLENVIDGFFIHAEKLFGLQFFEKKDIPVYHKDVKVFEVIDSKDKHVGLLYMDFFPRESKRAGAWQYHYRCQQGKTRPHVVIVCNFTKPTADQPSLISFNELTTFYHECGHALHTLLSDVKHPSLAGTSVLWDFVELPSQLMENWCLETECLHEFAKHYKTGELIPDELVEKIKKQNNFMKGIMGVRQMSFSLLDLLWHQQEITEDFDPVKFEKEVFAKTKLLDFEAENCFSCAFGHIFAGGYAVGYYSYKWAEVLEADIFDLFKTQGLYNQTIAEKLRSEILSKGNTVPPEILFANVRGREPNEQALLKKEGLL